MESLGDDFKQNPFGTEDLEVEHDNLDKDEKTDDIDVKSNYNPKAKQGKKKKKGPPLKPKTVFMPT